MDFCSNSIAIGKLPKELVKVVLHKMPNIPLHRMRLTCRSMNSLIEKSRKSLSERAKIGIEIQIYMRPGLGDKILIRNHRRAIPGEDSLLETKKRTFLVEEDVEQKLSAVAISKLYIGGTRLNIGQEITNLIKKLHLVCDSMEVTALPMEILEITEAVRVRNEIDVIPQCGNPFPYLKKSTKRSQMNLTLAKYFFISRTGLFDMIKEFRSVSLAQCSTGHLKSFLVDASSSTSLGALKEISCEIPFNQMIPLASTVPFYEETDHQEIFSGPLVMEGYKEIILFVNLIFLKTKTIIVTERMLCRENPRLEVTLEFVDPFECLSVVLEILLKALKIKHISDQTRHEFYELDSHAERQTLLKTLKKIEIYNAL